MFEDIEKILNTKKIRYDYMNELFRKFRKAFIPNSTINIFIDIPSTVKQLYNPENIKGLSGTINKKDKYIIASTILNMIGHYRHYFATRYQCYTNIVFMYNSKIDSKIKNDIDPDYKKTYYEKRFLLENPIFADLNLILKDNYKIMKSIIDFLPHCYFIDSTYRDYRCIFPFMIEQEEFEDNINIIITTDKLMYQNMLIGETIILQPKGDRSNVLTSNYIISEVAGNSKTIQNNPDYLTINPENILLIESMINHKDLDTTGIRNFSYLKAITFLNKNDIDINNIVINPDSLNEIFKGLLTKDELDKVKTNFKIYNNFYLSKSYEKDLEVMYTSSNKFIEDYDELRKTNEVFFTKHPLNLDFYFNGEVD